MKKISTAFFLSFLVLFFQSPLQSKNAKSPPQPKYQAKAEIYNSDGRQIGRAVFFETVEGVRIIVEVVGIPSGNHGIHIHEFGVCERPGFESAGEHFNPTRRQHGFKNKSGAHAGDIPNLKVEDESMAGRLEYVLTDVNLGSNKSSLLKEKGTSIVIHASYDDEISNPAGNSGSRIACGVIQPTF